MGNPVQDISTSLPSSRCAPEQVGHANRGAFESMAHSVDSIDVTSLCVWFCEVETEDRECAWLDRASIRTFQGQVRVLSI
jgi:hypothetical protein